MVTPAYEEGARIYESLRVLLTSMQQLGGTYEVILVSDGSSDATIAEAARHEEVHVLHYDLQRGKGYALRHGIARTRGDIVVFIDSDMELHPDGIGPLVELVREGADAAIGSKRHPDSKIEYPVFRRFQSAVFQLLIRALFQLNLTDTQTGLKVFRGDLLREVASSIKSDGFAFDLELLVALHDEGATIVEGPVVLDYSFETTTGLSAVANVLRDTFRIWRARP